MSKADKLAQGYTEFMPVNLMRRWVTETTALLLEQQDALRVALDVLQRASDNGYSIECEEAINKITEVQK